MAERTKKKKKNFIVKKRQLLKSTGYNIKLSYVWEKNIGVEWEGKKSDCCKAARPNASAFHFPRGHLCVNTEQFLTYVNIQP